MTSEGEAGAEEDWSWHDDLIHGLHLRSPDPDRQLWRSELVLDIDHIVERLKSEVGSIKWRIAPATLTFAWGRDLRVAVDFTGSALGSAVTECSIHLVRRTAVSPRDGYRGDPEHRWQIVLNLPRRRRDRVRGDRLHARTARGAANRSVPCRATPVDPVVLTSGACGATPARNPFTGAANTLNLWATPHAASRFKPP